jgi:hypothetical protein
MASQLDERWEHAHFGVRLREDGLYEATWPAIAFTLGTGPNRNAALANLLLGLLEQNGQPLEDPDWRLLLTDDRQRDELRFAETYATSFRHGTDDHHRLLLIARLAELLDFYRRIPHWLEEQRKESEAQQA